MTEKPKRKVGRPKGTFFPFDVTRKWVRSLKLTSTLDWKRYKKTHRLPRGIPANPHIIYADEYISDMDFFGNFYLPYRKVKEEVQKHQLRSLSEYTAWHKRVRPKGIPLRIDVVYRDEFKSWGDFFGTNRIAYFKIKYRSYEEAVRWTHAQNVTSTTVWYSKEFQSKRPQDIPRHPNKVYVDKWQGWDMWFGRTLASKVTAKKMDTTILYVVTYPNIPSNIFRILTDDLGIANIKERQNREEFDIIKAYRFDKSLSSMVNTLIDTYSTPWWEDERFRVTPNIHSIINELDLMFLPVIM